MSAAAIVVTGISTFSTHAGTPKKYEKSEEIGNLFGMAGDFSVFGYNHVNAQTHTVGNIATGGDLVGSSTFGGYDDHQTWYLNGTLPYSSKTIVRGKWLGGTSAWSSNVFAEKGTLYLGAGNVISPSNPNQLCVNGYTTDNKGVTVEVIEDMDTFFDFEEALAELKSISKEMAAYQPANKITSASIRLSDAAKYEDNIYVYNVTAKDYDNLNEFRINGLTEDDLCIINIDCRGYDKDWETPRMFINGENTSWNLLAANIVLNFIGDEEDAHTAECKINEATHYFECSDTCTVNNITILESAGQVLAPYSDINDNGNFNGTIMALSVNISAEAHHIALSKKFQKEVESVEESSSIEETTIKETEVTKVEDTKPEEKTSEETKAETTKTETTVEVKTPEATKAETSIEAEITTSEQAKVETTKTETTAKTDIKTPETTKTETMANSETSKTETTTAKEEKTSEATKVETTIAEEKTSEAAKPEETTPEITDNDSIVTNDSSKTEETTEKIEETTLPEESAENVTTNSAGEGNTDVEVSTTDTNGEFQETADAGVTEPSTEEMVEMNTIIEVVTDTNGEVVTNEAGMAETTVIYEAVEKGTDRLYVGTVKKKNPTKSKVKEEIDDNDNVVVVDRDSVVLGNGLEDGPKTGDHNQIGLLIVLLVVSAAGFLVMFTRKGKNTEEEE